MPSITHGQIWRRLAVAASAVLALALAPALSIQPAAAATPPAFDYTKIKGLSQPVHTELVRHQAFRLPMQDREEIYVEVTRPAAPGQYPVILEASPYHGTLADRDGTRILPEPRDEALRPLGVTGYFAPRGYAVVMMDLRGTGRSSGCLDHIGPKDRADMMEVIEWAAAQSWSNGRVGMTGHSYVGSTPSAAAAMRPPALKTIVPSAGLATMYDHQFQAGVPYFLQWAGPMEAYEQLALEREIGDNFPTKNPEDIGCGLPQSSLIAGEDQLSGRYSEIWHEPRDWADEATAADIPIFMVHGVNDNAARVPGMEWFTKRGGRAGDKIWLGQWDHGSGCCPTRRGLQWTYALHAWFDKHLALRDVDTGPDAELFLSDGTFEGARGGDRSQVLVSSAWPAPGASTLALYPDATNGGLGGSRPTVPGTASFTGDALGFEDPQATGGVDFATAPMTSDTVLAGQPELDLVASVTAPRVHLIANLYDQFPDGSRRRISQFAINPELRNGIETRTLVVPGEKMTLEPPGFAMAHNLRKGHKLVLRVTTSDPDKVPTFAEDPRITVFTGPGGTALQVPVVAKPKLHDDSVPLFGEPKKARPAQGPIQGSVTTAAAGPEVRSTGVASSFFEFEIEEGWDNQQLSVAAAYFPGGDIDLYLQRKLADDSWSDDLAVGGSFALTMENMTAPRSVLRPGIYRVEVHNYAAPPGMRVDLTLTFYNSDLMPGTGG